MHIKIHWIFIVFAKFKKNFAESTAFRPEMNDFYARKSQEDFRHMKIFDFHCGQKNNKILL